MNKSQSMTVEQFLALTGKTKAKPAIQRSERSERTIRGQVFDSKAEAARFDELEALRRAGEVKYFLRQPRFDLAGVKYSADFQVFWRDGRVTYEDVKGRGGPRFVTDRFHRSAKQVRTLYGVEVEAVFR